MGEMGGGKPRSRAFDGVGTNPTAVKRQERRVARDLGGRRQPGSGAFEWAKGDVSAADLMVSCKRTKHSSIGITWAMLQEVTTLASQRAVAPAMSFELTRPGRKVLGGRHGMDVEPEADWVLIPMSVFREMLEAYRERDGIS